MLKEIKDSCIDKDWKFVVLNLELDGSNKIENQNQRKVRNNRIHFIVHYIFPQKYPEKFLCSNNIVFEMWCWRKLRTHLSTSAADEWWKRTWVESLWGPTLQKVTFLQYLVILIEIIEKKFSWLLETAIQEIVKLLYQFVKNTRILILPSCKPGLYISLDDIHSWADFICSPSAYVMIFQLLLSKST